MTELTTCKQFSPWYLLAMAIGAMIGPWVVMMQWWLTLSGPSMALAYIVLGIMCIPIALVYAEMTSLIPVTGGPFQYTHTAFGKHVAFWSTWMLLLAYLSILGFLSCASIQIVRVPVWPDMCADPAGDPRRHRGDRGLAARHTVDRVQLQGPVLHDRLIMVVVAVAVVFAFVVQQPVQHGRTGTPFFPTGSSGFIHRHCPDGHYVLWLRARTPVRPGVHPDPARKFWKIIIGSSGLLHRVLLEPRRSSTPAWRRGTRSRATLMIDATIAEPELWTLVPVHHYDRRC